MILPPVARSSTAQNEVAEAARLGTTAKSLDAPPQSPVSRALKAHRALRYQAHSQGRQWLVAQAKAERPEKHPGDVFRTADCRYVNHGDVGVNYSAKYQAAHYAGLVTCGSVWACPVCASRIQERRRGEIQQAIDWAKAEGHTVVLVTFTFPHNAWQKLRDLLDRQAEAFRRLRDSRGYKRLKPMGLIRSLEVTHGVNGWHPHTHELWIMESRETRLQPDLAHLWLAACQKAGLVDPSDFQRVAAFLAHGVDVKYDMDAGDYLAKQDDSRSWGFAEEVSKAASKAGRAKGVHPHHFLVRKADGDRQRYIEYVKGMKGKRQLYWTNGLKAAVGVTDVTDETLADESLESAELLGLLTPDDWKLIRGNDARAELLDAAEHGGWKAVQALLCALR